MSLQRRVFLVAAALLLATPLALATGPHTTPTPTPEPSKPTANAASTSGSKSNSKAAAQAKSASQSASKSDSSSVSKATGGAATAAGGDADALATAEGGANSLSMDYRDRLQAPSISAPPVYASGPCSSGWSAGLSVPGVGASGGKSKPDASCDRRELIRVVTPLNPWLALKIACEDPLIVEMRLRNLATLADCTYVPPAPPPSAPPSNSVTREEVSVIVDRAFKQTTKK